MEAVYSLTPSKSSTAKYHWDCACAKLMTGLRAKRNQVDAETTHVLGGYHNRNTGDSALWKAVGRVDKRAVPAIWGVPFPIASPARIVLGGGSVITENNINYLIKQRIAPEIIDAVGVDGINLANYCEEHVRYVKKIRSISVRSKRGFTWLTNSGYPSERASFAFDNAFSLFHGEESVKSALDRVVGINMLPHFYSFRKYKFIERQAEKNWTKKNGYSVERIRRRYVEGFRSLVSKYLSEGYKVLHIPFTPEDNAFASAVLKGLPVTYSPFSNQVHVIKKRLQCCRFLVASRYHAMVFGLGLGIPTAFFCYTLKNESLLDDIGVPSVHSIDNQRMSEMTEDEWSRQLDVLKPYVVDSITRKMLTESSRRSLEVVLSSACGRRGAA